MWIFVSKSALSDVSAFTYKCIAPSLEWDFKTCTAIPSAIRCLLFRSRGTPMSHMSLRQLSK